MKWIFIGLGGFFLGFFASASINRRAMKKRADLWAKYRAYVEKCNKKAEALIETGEMWEKAGCMEEAIECYQTSRRWSDKSRSVMDQFEIGESHEAPDVCNVGDGDCSIGR